MNYSLLFNISLDTNYFLKYVYILQIIIFITFLLHLARLTISLKI